MATLDTYFHSIVKLQDACSKSMFSTCSCIVYVFCNSLYLLTSVECKGSFFISSGFELDVFFLMQVVIKDVLKMKYNEHFV